MIHTMQITKKIFSVSQFDRIYNSFAYKFKDKKSNNNYTIYNVLDYSETGLNKIILTKKTNKGVNKKTGNEYSYIDFRISMIINPSRILRKSNPIAIMHQEDIDLFIFKFDKILQQIDESLVSCKTWSIKRIDYTRNIDLNIMSDLDADIVNKYIQLFSRADTPTRCKVPYHKIKKDRKQKEGSYVVENKSVTFICYNKEKERMDKQKDDEIDYAKNILRLEIQCKNPRIRQITYKNKWDTNFLYHFLDYKISYETLQKYYKASIGEGDYYSLNKARKLINETSKIKHKDKKQKLIEVLNLINTKKSVADARKEYGNINTFNRYLKELQKLGINPVTIPRSWNITEIPNVWYQEDLDDNNNDYFCTNESVSDGLDINDDDIEY